MILLGILLDGNTIESDDFGNKNFETLMNKHLGKGKTSSEVGKGLQVILNYKSGQTLGVHEQIQITTAVVAMNAKLIIDGESDTSDIPERDTAILNTLKTFSIRIEDYLTQIHEVLHESGAPELLCMLGGNKFGIYVTKENNRTIYYVADSRNPEGNNYGYVVTEDGESFDSLGDTDFIYCLINNEGSTDVWSGTLDAGFTLTTTLKGFDADNLSILQKGFLCYTEDDIFYIFDIANDAEVFTIETSQISDATDSGNPVDMYTFAGKSLFIYLGYDSNGNEVYYVQDKDDEIVFKSYPYPHPILTSHGYYVALYSQEENRYYLANDKDGILTKSIIAFIDDEDNYFFGGSFPESIIKPNGTCELRFIHELLDEEGNPTIKHGYIISGIESDVIPKKERKPIPDILSIDSPSQYNH
ncbi:hypothetical protein LAT59_00515 [Candidatus Gracilibacteria bacterium]|nr:hypothetical protein [Candidatus Gracilibacteria bacterium]